MRKLIVTGAVAGIFAIGGVAQASGPSGSSEDNTQEVTCAGSASFGFVIYTGANGAEVCSDGNDLYDGRVIVDTDEGYVAWDNDYSNGFRLNGYVRVDGNGATCSSPTDTDSTDGGGTDCVQEIMRAQGLSTP